MPTFTPKIYQQEALDSIAAYFRECQNRGHADYAFQETTKQLWGKKSQFTPLKGFSEEMPYFCLRVPTGGGKTYLAAKSVALVKNELLINAPLSAEETKDIEKIAVLDDTRELIRQAGEHSRTKAVTIFAYPAEKGASFLVPQMEVMINGELHLFDEPEALDYPWELPLYEAAPNNDQLTVLFGAATVKEGGVIDIDEDQGKVTTKFARNLQRDLSLSYKPEHWNEAKLAAWFCRQIHDSSITHASKRTFISQWLNALLRHDNMSLARVNRQKFLLRNLINDQINSLRNNAIIKEYQQFLFGEGNDKRVRISSEYQFEFHPDAYAPHHDYEGQYGDYAFQKHYYPRMGDFDSREEYLCACWLDRQKEIEFWVRNLVRKDGSSFFLQNATGRFYPDFVCKLTDGRILVVEYKGAVYWEAASANRKLGNLWAELSKGKGLFVMVTEQQWERITQTMQT